MSKGPEGIDRSGGNRLIQAFAAALGPDAVQVINKPDGSRALAISVGGGGVSAPDPMIDRLRMQSWLAANAKPELGTQQDRESRREDLFEKLRNITPEIVIDLCREYFSVFPKHPGADDYGDIANTGASILSNHEGYFFDPDRVVEMCRALQDAVKRLLKKLKDQLLCLRLDMVLDLWLYRL